MFKPPEIPEKHLKNMILKAPMVRLLVLHVISKESICGNRIAEKMDKMAERMESKMKDFPHGSEPGNLSHKLNPNILYPLLHDLEKDGFIKGKWEHPSKRTRRIYTITSEGKVTLRQLKKIFKPRIKEMLQTMRKISRELFGKGI